MKRKLLLVVLALLIVSVFLAACGQKQEEGTSEPAPSTETTTPSTEGQGSKEPAPAPEPEKTAEAPEGWSLASDKSQIPAASKARTDTIIVGMNATQGIFNPLFSSTAYDYYVDSALFDALIAVEKDASFVPSIAKEWKISEDGLTYTFTLRDDVKFSDGTPLTAADAEFSFYVYADPAYDGDGDLSKAAIKGWDAYKNGDATTIEGIKVLDDYTLEIQVDEVRATTLGLLGVSVLPKAYYGKDFTKGNLDYLKSLHQKPLGSGPFIFNEYIPGQEVRLVANENYWQGAPKIKNLIFKATTGETNIQMLQTGETDFEEGISVNKDNVELLQSFGFLDLSLLPNNGYGYIAFNLNLPKFQDKRVRQALAYGLNREEIVYAYSQGYAEVINVPQSKVSWAYPDESELIQYEFNLEKANQLLDEAGWVKGDDGYRYKDGEKFVIYFAASSPNPVNDAIIPYATESYKELGIEFIPEQLEFNAVVEKRNKGDFDMLFMAWGLSVDPDPSNIFSTTGSQNDIGYSNPEADRLMEAGLKELDPAKRKEIYNNLYKILNEDLPYIYMYQRKNMNTINARVQGFDISPYKDFTSSLYAVEIQE